MTATAIIGIILLISFIIIAVKVSVKQPQEESPDKNSSSGPLIHTSGIYSIIRKSPREMIGDFKPAESELRKYLAGINEDMNGVQLTGEDKEKLLKSWSTRLNENIKTVEMGDNAGIAFYSYNLGNNNSCPVCVQKIIKGKFVTREDIFKNPALIPPLHLGCTTKLVSYQGKENLKETRIIGMAPFYDIKTPPVLPDWRCTVKLI